MDGIVTVKNVLDISGHNAVVFDTRFRNIDPNSAMRQCLKMLQVSNTELKAFIREFEKITDSYINSVNSNVAAIVIHLDLSSRMNLLKQFI